MFYTVVSGPTKDMINDFWDMVWQQDCGKIVMLTNLKEENKVSCIRLVYANSNNRVSDSMTTQT